jgi:hypothetical protein
MFSCHVVASLSTVTSLRHFQLLRHHVNLNVTFRCHDAASLSVFTTLHHSQLTHRCLSFSCHVIASFQTSKFDCLQTNFLSSSPLLSPNIPAIYCDLDLRPSKISPSINQQFIGFFFTFITFDIKKVLESVIINKVIAQEIFFLCQPLKSSCPLKSSQNPLRKQRKIIFRTQKFLLSIQLPTSL